MKNIEYRDLSILKNRVFIKNFDDELILFKNKLEKILNNANI